MSFPIFLSEDYDYSSLSFQEKNFFKQICQSIPASNLKTSKNMHRWLSSQDFQEAVFIPFFSSDGAEKKIEKMLSTIRHSYPLSKLFGILIIIKDQESSGDFLSAEWVDIIDSIYDYATPTLFLIWGKENPTAFSLTIRASVSSLFREIQNINEIRSISEQVKILEEKMIILEKNSKSHKIKSG